MAKQEKTPEYYRNEARNILWGIASFGILSTIVVLVALVLGAYRTKLDGKALGAALGVLCYCIIISVSSIIAGIRCGQGKKSGRLLAHIPVILLMPGFPIGTILSILVLEKLNKREFVNSLKTRGELWRQRGGTSVRQKQDGRTPLHRAVLNKSLVVAELLLANGAEVDAKDTDGRTPLHEAAKYGYLPVAKLLLANGADPNLKDRYGKTPLDEMPELSGIVL